MLPFASSKTLAFAAVREKHVVLLLPERKLTHDKHETQMNLLHKNSKCLKGCMAAACKELAIPTLASAHQQVWLVF